jgi:hypothetical protein
MIYFDVVISNNIDDIRDLVKNGYCPVECSIGGESIVDSLKMDHHGQLSGLEGVALRAYRDHFGDRRGDPRFVVTGICDADAAFAIASLAGVLPHPSRAAEFENAPPPIKAAWCRDLTSLAELVNLVDTDPVSVNLGQTPEGDKLLLWGALFGGADSSLLAAAAVGGWVQLLARPPFILAPLFAAAKETEIVRREKAQEDWAERGQHLWNDVGVVAHSRVWGFDIWYGRQNPDLVGPEGRSGWARPVVLALVEGMGGITIGCPNEDVAEEVFGPGGLLNVLPKLDAIAPGWGGREAIGGSPRGRNMTEEDLQAAARIVVGILDDMRS